MTGLPDARQEKRPLRQLIVYRLYVTARTLLLVLALGVTVAGSAIYVHDAAAQAELRACMAKPRDKSEGETIVVEPPAVAVVHAPMIGLEAYTAADPEPFLLSQAYDCHGQVSGRTVYSNRAWSSAGFEPGEKWSTPVLKDWLPGLVVWLPLVSLVGAHRWFGWLTRPG
jgi:hypothetical protein